jgi:hypothetical protein
MGILFVIFLLQQLIQQMVGEIFRIEDLQLNRSKAPHSPERRRVATQETMLAVLRLVTSKREMRRGAGKKLNLLHGKDV